MARTTTKKNSYTYTGKADPDTGRYLGYDELIRKGDSGQAVTDIQNALNTWSGGTLNLNSGTYDDATAAAVSAYKQAMQSVGRGSGNTYGTTIGNNTLKTLFATPSSVNSGNYNPETDNRYLGEGTYGNQQLAGLTSNYNSGVSSLGSAYNSGKAQANANYDEMARQYYINSRQNENALSEQLSNLGITGGGSETALMNILNAYGTNLQNNENYRNQVLADLNNTYMNNLSSLNSSYSSAYNNLYGQLAQAEAEYDAQRQAEDNAMLQAYAQNMLASSVAAAAAAEQAKVDQWNSNVQDRMAEQLAKGDTIYTWTGDDGRMHWTTYQSKGIANGGAKLTASNYQKKKVANSSSSSSSGSSRGSSSSSSRGSSSSGSTSSSGSSNRVSSPAAGTDYVLAYTDITGYGGLRPSTNPLANRVGATAALQSLANSLLGGR